MVLLEAMQYGLPCIAYKTESGVSDIIFNNKNGFIIYNRDEKEYVNKLNYLLCDVNTVKKFSKNAIKTADTLKQALKEKGYTFYIDSPTNQIFLVLEDERLKELEQKVAVSFWEKADDNHTIIRLATSWATKEEEIKALIEIL